MLFSFFQLVVGAAFLVWGADSLVKGASNIARRFGLSSLFIGLTVVAFGTSAPELAVSLLSASKGTYELAVGNVVGSNIANILVILGLSALVKPLVFDRQIIKFDLPVMVVASLMMWYFCYDGVVSIFEGCILTFSFFAYLFMLWRSVKKGDSSQEQQEEKAVSTKLSIDILITILGLVGLVVGSQAVVAGATSLAKACGVSDLLIGLTIVAVGTSLPEIATAVVATAKGQCDMAIGNVVGSNISNIFLILGSSSIFSSGKLNVGGQVLARDLPVMTAAACICLPLFFTGMRVDRWEGCVLLVGYIFYVAISAMSELLDDGSLATTLGVVYCYLILSCVVIFISVWREFRLRKSHK